ncbi:hypothetical protein ACOSP7_004150 [Xanthoceras sorbifolium]
MEMESLYEAWERYKDTLRKCPHHGLPDWLVVQTFYNGLTLQNRSMLDASAQGALMSKPADVAHQLIEEMSTNSYIWAYKRACHKKAVGSTIAYEVDEITSLKAQVASLSSQINKWNVNSIQSATPGCDNCGEPHGNAECTVGYSSFAGTSVLNRYNMCKTSASHTTTYTQALTILDGEITQISHGEIISRIAMRSLDHLVFRIKAMFIRAKEQISKRGNQP